MRVIPGLEVLLRDGLFKGKKLGLVTNHTGVDFELNQNVDLLLKQGYRVTTLFSPEHGLYGDHPDGHLVEGHRDKTTGIYVHSLYGATQRPTRDMLKDVDILVYDIQDIGSRYYTYTSTMLLCMEAASSYGIPFVILDRPNPLGGLEVEGNVTHPEWISLVAGARVAIRHGMTVGEIAMMVASEKGIETPKVIKMEGWTRDMYFQDTGIPWVPTSPNAPTMDMAILYPGTCLVEGTNLSEGRGTSLPFQVIGAPWVDGRRLAEALRREKLPGIAVRPVFFRPAFSKWTGEVCEGVQVHVIDPKKARPVELGVRILFTVRDLFPDDFRLRAPGATGRYFIDLLGGGPDLSEALQKDESPDNLLESWRSQAEEFAKRRRDFLIYD
ncbi:MAG TPA: DUF1343 domain-containing protein [Firmicutes bacterium]|nr:DUF1343 domain-containing protein [Candidatus Fermentithermobacillaceae bacterium]